MVYLLLRKWKEWKKRASCVFWTQKRWKSSSETKDVGICGENRTEWKSRMSRRMQLVYHMRKSGCYILRRFKTNKTIVVQPLLFIMLLAVPLFGKKKSATCFWSATWLMSLFCMQLTHRCENGTVVEKKNKNNNKFQYISGLLGNLINPEPADEEIISNCHVSLLQWTTKPSFNSWDLFSFSYLYIFTLKMYRQMFYSPFATVKRDQKKNLVRHRVL